MSEGSCIWVSSVSMVLLGCTAIQAADIDYDAELERAKKAYPPGDYDSMPVRRFSPVTEVPKAPSSFDLFAPVEPSDKDAKTLSSEAASYFTVGRWDLATTRYKQLLLSEPGNTDAKVNLYDLLELRVLYADPERRSEAAKKNSEMRDRLSKDIIPSGGK